MADYLDRILKTKEDEVRLAKSQVPLEEIKRWVCDAPPALDFAAAMTHPQGELRVIAEIKKASPSAGVIRSDFDPVVIAKAYEENGAAAISCLTDATYFQGSLDYLRMVKKAVSIPVLRKDFIIDEYQIFEARAAGADAVLLIAECLGSKLAELREIARSLRMTTLIEVRSADSLRRVLPMLGLPSHPTLTLLGINNRDLKTMKTNVRHTLQLLGWCESADIVVSESGINNPKDVARLRDANVHRILIGEHLMRQQNVGLALRQLISESESQYNQRSTTKAFRSTPHSTLKA